MKSIISTSIVSLAAVLSTFGARGIAPWAVRGARAAETEQDGRPSEKRPVRLDIDATQIARHLITSELTLPASAGTMALRFPEWIPGIHGPGEQIRNVGGLEIVAADGQPIVWHRDKRDLYKFVFDVPEGNSTIRVALTYIANQPTRTSVGVDTAGDADLAVINPNTCLLYPEQARASRLRVAMRIKFPRDWQVASGLRHTRDGQWTTFRTATLEQVVDSPVIAGRYAKTIRLHGTGRAAADAAHDGPRPAEGANGSKTIPKDFPPVFLDLVAESPAALRLSDERIAQYRRLVAEAAALFGSAPFDEYHLLVTCSDRIAWMGLEHLDSSLNGVAERAMVEEDKHKDWPAYLLPHEFVHAWCGKYRRPAGMVTDNYHDPKDTSLLWIYEGLTQYLGEVLTVRSGLVGYDDYRDRLARKYGYLAQRTGRRWRALEDTAIAGHTLRGGSKHWVDLRRDQDYYNEGVLFWMEVDAIIREKTRERASLDDFCRRFFRRRSGTQARVIPYDLSEVIETLDALAPFDWQGLIRRRIALPQARLSADVLDRVGYRIAYVAERPESLKEREEARKTVSADDAIGLTASRGGEIKRVVPEGHCDRAGLAEGMKIVGVNGRKFSPQRLRDALADSTTRRSIDLLILDGDRFRSVTIPYAEGPRYITLVPNPNREDRLKAIFQP